MAKHKKKQSKKDSVADNFLDVTAVSIKKYRKMTNELAKLSTKQKLVGGLALLTAGFFYFTKTKSDNSQGALLSELKSLFPNLLPDTTPQTPPSVPTQNQDKEEHAVASHKSSKATKQGRGTGTFGKKSAVSPHDL